MLRYLSKQGLRLFSKEKKYVQRLLHTKYTLEETSYENTDLFPKEDGFIQNSVYGDRLSFPSCTLDQYVWMNVNEYSRKSAIVCGITGKSYSYAKLRDYCGAFSLNLLKKFSLNKGDIVTVCLPNIPEFAIASLGVIEADLILSTVNPIYTANEIAKQLIDSKAKLLIGLVENYPTLIKAVAISKKDVKVICVKSTESESIPDGTINFFELLDTKGISFAELDKKGPIDLNATVMLPYSSGTTGLPKGVELTHRNFISNCEMQGAKMNNQTMTLPTSDTHQDVLPCVLPFFHCYGWSCTLISKLHLGCKLVTLPTFKPETFLNALDEHKATVLYLVPPIVIFLSNYEKVESKHTDSLRMVMSGAAPLGANDVERFNLKAPKVQFAQGYGLTETSPVALMQAIGNKNFASVGSPSPATQAKIVKLNDSTMKGLGPNERGEILIRGTHIMKKYFNNDKATNESIVNGWFRTGDIGYYDENNQFYITDRLKELIKVKGFQVAPAELEELLRSHPKVADAAVIGIPHDTLGEMPKGFIVSKSNVTVSEKEILDFVKDKVAVYKRLGSVMIIDSIPKNATGKIMRRELKQKYEN